MMEIAAFGEGEGIAFSLRFSKLSGLLIYMVIKKYQWQMFMNVTILFRKGMPFRIFKIMLMQTDFVGSKL